MAVKNCPECGKMFEVMYREICPDCIDREEEDFLKVKDFLWEHSGRTPMEDIIEATGVKRTKLLRFISLGRLEAEGLSHMIEKRCSVCGTVVEDGNNGHLCAGCSAKFSQGFERAKEQQKALNAFSASSRGQGGSSAASKPGQKMYTYDRIRKD